MVLIHLTNEDDNLNELTVNEEYKILIYYV